MLRTIYKSPSSVHIFGFSTDNTDLFHIPPIVDPVIRTQIDLQAWSIEALSPNTTQVTLLEQSDPRGWSNKSSIPMMSTLAGIGEFAIKHGGPPIVTRLGGAKMVSTRYDIERETYKVEYVAAARRSNSSSIATAFDPSDLVSTTMECEIRCDDKWTNNFIVVIDPPQRIISALKRHRFSPDGGGLWLTIEHDTDKVVVTVRRGAPSAKTMVTVNGSRIKVDVQEFDVELLKKQKRSRPTRAPLDQPIALGRKRPNEPLRTNPTSRSPFARLAAAVRPVTVTPTEAPVDAAVRALTQLMRMHADRDGESTDPHGWQPVSNRGLRVEKRIVPHVSEIFPVYRAGRLFEGFTAEEVSAAVERDAPSLQSYGHGITASFTTVPAYPLRDRGLLVASVTARSSDVIFHASAAFDPRTVHLDPAKYNPTNLPMGRIILEGWVLETIDADAPLTRCVYVSAVDYGTPFNVYNASLPKALLGVESRLRTNGPPIRVRTPSMMVGVPEGTTGPWGLQGVDERIGISQSRDQYTLVVSIKPTAQQPRNRYEDRQDFCVLEVDLDHKGCDVQIRALPIMDPLPLKLPPGQLDLPFKCSIIAGRSPLLRVTLPTCGYDTPDPLSGKAALPRPRWLLDLISDGIVVELKLVPSTKYMYDGVELVVEEDKRKREKSRLAQLVR
jgi:hypothetical protein